MSSLGKLIRKTITYIFPRMEYNIVAGSIIPSPDRRWCGPEFKDNDFYLKSAEAEANRLINNLQFTQKSRVLDIGCGQGRLPIGILRVIGDIDYTGIDIDKRSIDWCIRYIEGNHPTYKFKHLNLYNERYNKKGAEINADFRFEMVKNSIDIVYLYSVFSHTTEEDMKVYLKEFSRILDKEGKIFFTTFVEEDVPNFSINPDDHNLKCSGPMHVVRYNKDYLLSIFDEYGFSILRYEQGVETGGQSAIYLSKKN